MYCKQSWDLGTSKTKTTSVDKWKRLDVRQLKCLDNNNTKDEIASESTLVYNNDTLLSQLFRQNCWYFL